MLKRPLSKIIVRLRMDFISWNYKFFWNDFIVKFNYIFGYLKVDFQKSNLFIEKIFWFLIFIFGNQIILLRISTLIYWIAIIILCIIKNLSIPKFKKTEKNRKKLILNSKIGRLKKKVLCFLPNCFMIYMFRLLFN